MRAWTIRRGANSVDAAHAIHSDLARGFIRAEVMKYDDLVGAASGLPAEASAKVWHAAEIKLKETRKLYIKGKDYIVEDGDIINIRHSS